MKHRFPTFFAALAAFLLCSTAPLRAQEVAPADQDKVPSAAVVAPAQSSMAAPGAPAPAPAAEAAPVAAPAPAPVPAVQPDASAPPVALEAPTSPPVPAPAPVAKEWIDRGEVVIFGNDVLIRENERASKVVAIGGDVDMRGRVDGEVVAIGGDLMIDGPVGKAVAVLGDVTLGAKASVAGEVVSVLGDLDNPHQVPIRGQAVAIGGFLPKLSPMFAWAADAATHARLLSPHLAWPWYAFGAGVLFFLLLAAIFGRGVNACARVLEESPGTTLGTAIVLLPLLPLFVLLLICTGIGILFLPFLAVVVLFAFAFGKAAVLAFLGRCVLRPFGAEAAAERAWLAVLVGAVLLGLLYCVPVVGLLVWALTAWVGFGMVVAALLLNRRSEKARVAAQRQAASVAAPRPVAASAAASAAAAPVVVSPVPAAAAGEAVSPGADGGAEVPIVEQPVAGAVPPVIPQAPAVAPVLEAATLPRADFGMRLGAILIDIILVAVAGGVSMAYALLPFPLLFGGYVFGFWLWKGTTVGGIILNLKVVRLDGRPVDAGTSLVRTLVGFLSVFALGLGFLWCLWDPECQTWHDKVAGTVVVRVPKSVSLV